MEWVLGTLMGIGLAAACGFRVFVPPLVLSIAALSGHLDLSPGFAWMGTWPALAAFSVATALEIVGYYFPWVDNLLDTIATPMAVVAGVVVSASCVTGMSPFLKWTLCVIAGGGAAGLVQILTVKARAISSLFTAGVANPILSTLETATSASASALVVLLPVLALVLLSAIVGMWLWVSRRRGTAPV